MGQKDADCSFPECECHGGDGSVKLVECPNECGELEREEREACGCWVWTCPEYDHEEVVSEPEDFEYNPSCRIHHPEAPQ